MVSAALAAVLLASAASAWTDDILTPNQTKIRAVHVQEMRDAINVKRQQLGMAPFAFADALVPNATPVSQRHFAQLRRAVEECWARSATPLPEAWLDGPLTPHATKVRAAHVLQLRRLIEGCPVCSCPGFSAGGCGDFGCPSSRRAFWRTCSPNGCGPEVDCRADPSCAAGPSCNCGNWAAGACGNGANGCAVGTRVSTRSCTPPPGGCPTVKCDADAACGEPPECECDPWVDGQCASSTASGSGGTCSAGQRERTRTCNRSDCGLRDCRDDRECPIRVQTRSIAGGGDYLTSYDDMRHGPRVVCQLAGFPRTNGQFQCGNCAVTHSERSGCEVPATRCLHNGAWQTNMDYDHCRGDNWCSQAQYIIWVECLK